MRGSPQRIVVRHSRAHIATEGEYFYRQDVELIAELRRRAAREERRSRLAAACRTRDPDALGLLERLGFTDATVSLLCLAPPVQVAWIDGSVSHSERNHILAIASRHGVTIDTPAYRQLLAWFDQRPSEEFFGDARRAIHRILESLPPEDQHAMKDEMLGNCLDVASASGGFLGLTSRISAAERALIDQIRKCLEPDRQVAA